MKILHSHDSDKTFWHQTMSPIIIIIDFLIFNVQVERIRSLRHHVLALLFVEASPQQRSPLTQQGLLSAMVTPFLREFAPDGGPLSERVLAQVKTIGRGSESPDR